MIGWSTNSYAGLKRCRAIGLSSGTREALSSELKNLAPWFGLQFFGHVAIDGATEVMTVTLKDWDNRALRSTTLGPKIG